VFTKLPKQTSWSVSDASSVNFRPNFTVGHFYEFTWNESMYGYMKMSEKSILSGSPRFKPEVSLSTVESGSVLFYLGSEEFACGLHMTNDKCLSCFNLKIHYGLPLSEKGTSLRFIHNGQILYLHSDYLLEYLRVDEVELD
jgi:hypothetical protein